MDRRMQCSGRLESRGAALPGTCRPGSPGIAQLTSRCLWLWDSIVLSVGGHWEGGPGKVAFRSLGGPGWVAAGQKSRKLTQHDLRGQDHQLELCFVFQLKCVLLQLTNLYDNKRPLAKAKALGFQDANPLH